MLCTNVEGHIIMGDMGDRNDAFNSSLGCILLTKKKNETDVKEKKKENQRAEDDADFCRPLFDTD